MNFSSRLIQFSLNKPKTLTFWMLFATLILALLASLPSIWPYTFSMLNPVHVDTDPENMLKEDAQVRVFHNKMKKAFSLNDMVVLGIVNDDDKQGVFNQVSLHRIYEITRYSERLTWPSPENLDNNIGVLKEDTIAPSTVDNVEQTSMGAVNFEWLMGKPPLSSEEAVAIRNKAQNIPFLDGTLVSEDGKAIALYLSLSSKKLSHRVYSNLKEQIPLLWLWGPINLELRKHPYLSQNGDILDSVQKLGRLAANYGKSRKQFAENINLLAKQLEQGKGDEWKRIKNLAKDWRKNAKGLQSEHQSRIAAVDSDESDKLSQRAQALKLELSKESIAAFRNYLKNKSSDKSASKWIPYANLYLSSLKNRVLSATELVDHLKDFSDRMQQDLGTVSDDLELNSQIESTLQKYQNFPGEDKYHITGLPVAEDTFGVEMFKQMAISAPLAMLVIFILLLVFFRKLLLIIAPMIVALVSVILTMGLLVITGNTVHIMSSMIPIFIMPIAVLDTVHVLSEFFDRYPDIKDRGATMTQVMDSLFQPMLFTSLTTAAGFASLALTPIPPVQVFGLFVAFGVIMAWFWTITFLPAYIKFIPEHRLQGLGTQEGGEQSTFLTRMLSRTGEKTFKYAKLILLIVAILVIIAIYGLKLIVINDNPTKWFTYSHPIRVADRVLNEHFGGTYMAYLTLKPGKEKADVKGYMKGFQKRIEKRLQETRSQFDNPEKAFTGVMDKAEEIAKTAKDKDAILNRLQKYAEQRQQEAAYEKSFLWDEILSFLDSERQRDQIFKQPRALKYIDKLQKHLDGTGLVGKSNSLAGIVKTVHRELRGSEEAFRIPDSSSAVAQTLMTFQNSHRPQDLRHFVTHDYKKGCLWLQLKSGDNKHMNKVIQKVQNYVKNNPPPFNLKQDWFGLTYINVKWQDKMVSGMLKAFMGSFLVVLFMMSILFRSALWGILCMVPLTVTIAIIYGMIGYIGKPYDMPVAVLSSLSLGLAIDYAIHFLARSRNMHGIYGSWKDTVGNVFGEPARAISRNVIIIGAGFLPLLAAPLTPYKTVGIFIAAILVLAGLASLLILPSMIRLLENLLFPNTTVKALTCQGATLFIIVASAAGLVLINLQQIFDLTWRNLFWTSSGGIMVIAILCSFVSNQKRCHVDTTRVDRQNGDS